MTRRISKGLAPTVITALALAAPGGAMAATSVPATATGTISAGTLALATSAAPAFSDTLNGADQTATYTVPATITDATGSGSGWNLTISPTQFTTGGGTPHTLATSASSITGVTSAAVAGSTTTAPSNSVTYGPLSILTGSATKYFNAAANSGMGQFTITPTVQVAIPANTYQGTYTSTLTLSIVSGP